MYLGVSSSDSWYVPKNQQFETKTHQESIQCQSRVDKTNSDWAGAVRFLSTKNLACCWTYALLPWPWWWIEVLEDPHAYHQQRVTSERRVLVCLSCLSLLELDDGKLHRVSRFAPYKLGLVKTNAWIQYIAAEEASGHSEAPPSHWGGRTLLDWWVATWDGNSCKGVSDLFENNQISMQVELLSMWSKWYSIHWIGVVKTYRKPWFFQVFSSFPHQIPDLFPSSSGSRELAF